MSDSSWIKKQDFSENKIIFIKFSKADDYDICVKVKDDSGTMEKKYFTVSVNNGVLKNTSTISSQSISIGESVTVNASATGGNGSYKYAVYYKQSTDSPWTTKQSFSDNKTVSINLSKAVKYDICVKVKDNNGTIEKKYFTVSVDNGILANTSAISSQSIKLGESVTVNASATGGDGNYTYAVLYKKTTDSSWTTKQNFSANPTVTINPAKAVSYDMCVKVKDGSSSNTIAKKYFTIDVTN